MNSIGDSKKESTVEMDGDEITFPLKDIELYSSFKEGMDYGDKLDLVDVNDMKEEDKFPIFSDALFKSVFGNTNRKKYICKLLSYYLKDVTVEELEKNIVFLKNEQDKTNMDDKARRIDLNVQIGNMRIDIEVNNCGTVEMMERNIEYLCRAYGEQGKSGKAEKHDYVIGFFINNFTDKSGRDFDVVGLKNSDGKLIFDKLIILQIFLPTLDKKYKEVYNKDVNKLSERERFLLMVSTSDRKESDKLCVKGDKIMEDYQKEVSEISHNKAVIDEYTKEWEEEQKALERERIGTKRGEKLGMERGIKQGISQKAREVVETMLQDNEPIDKVLKYSGLSEKEILEIKKELDSK